MGAGMAWGRIGQMARRMACGTSALLVLAVGMLFGPVASAQDAAPSACEPGAARAAPAISGRVALVVSNQAYGENIGALTVPHADGERLCRALEAAGFSVTLARDLDFRAFQTAVIEHGRRLSAAGPQGVGFFYYSGHGAALEEDGDNFLIPVDADIRRAEELPGAALRLGDIQRTIDGGGYQRSQANFIVIDACRNVAFQRSVRGGTKGLVPVREEGGTFIAFSTAPGDVALDAPHFSTVLAEALQVKGLPAYQAFRHVRRAVLDATRHDQFPWFRDGLVDDFYFLGGPEDSAAAIRATSTRPDVRRVKGRPVLSDPECETCPEMMVIDAAERGDAAETGFAISLHEVTFADWDRCAADGGCGRYWPDDEGWGRDRRPVINVSLEDAQAYVDWLARTTEKPFRLPTNAEWTAAARAGAPEGQAYAHGDDREKICRSANGGDHHRFGGLSCDDGFFRRTAPVGSLESNEFGLSDMAGNVWEWVSGCADGSEVANGPGAACARLLRGGSWESGAAGLTISARRVEAADVRRPTVGFRVALDWPL